MADDFELDDEERTLIEKRRASRQRDDRVVRIRDDRGNEAEGPLSELGVWIKRTFGLDPEGEPVQEEDIAVPKGKGKGGAEDTVKRFAGRRIS